MAVKQPDDNEAPAPFVPEIRYYPVTSPAGHTEHQVILVVSEPDENGAVRGFPLGYRRDAGQFQPHQFATG